MSAYEHGMVVAAQPEAVEAGAATLRAGGNAVDAAIAAGLVAGVVDPQMCGIAGFGNLQVYLPAAGVHRCIDFHAKSPLATKPDQWEDLIVGETRDGFGFILDGHVNDVGYQAVATPGSLKAYFEAQTTWGGQRLGRDRGPCDRVGGSGVRRAPTRRGLVGKRCRNGAS